MNRFEILSRWVLLLALVTGVTSCKIEGPEGKPGQDGADGNANVKTQLITVTPGNWSGNGYLFTAQKQCSIITADIVNSGAVLCYEKSGTNSYTPMPYTFTEWYENETGQIILYNNHNLFEYSPGAITFAIQDDDGMTQQPNANIVYKVIAIASSELVAHINTDTYSEVAAALQLKD